MRPPGCWYVDRRASSRASSAITRGLSSVFAPARARALTQGALIVPVGGLATAYLALRSGGFFPDSVGIVATLLAFGFLLWVTTAHDPVGGWSPIATVAAAAGALLATWTLLSALWSDAPARATLEFDRVLLYLLAF